MNGRLKDRFEIGHHLEGLIGLERTKLRAFEHAVCWAASCDYPDALRQMRVYDSMAHAGHPDTYATQDGKIWYPIR